VGLGIFLQISQCFILANFHNLAKKKEKRKEKKRRCKRYKRFVFGREKTGPIRHIMREKKL
jgi:hypothetical protein